MRSKRRRVLVEHFENSTETDLKLKKTTLFIHSYIIKFQLIVKLYYLSEVFINNSLVKQIDIKHIYFK